MLKLCKDCRHYQHNSLFPYCLHPKLSTISLVDGKSEPHTCSTQRMMSADCGPNGELFEPSEAQLEKWEAELERDRKIEASRERSQDRADQRKDFDFERDCGARP